MQLIYFKNLSFRALKSPHLPWKVQQFHKTKAPYVKLYFFNNHTAQILQAAMVNVLIYW